MFAWKFCACILAGVEKPTLNQFWWSLALGASSSSQAMRANDWLFGSTVNSVYHS